MMLTGKRVVVTGGTGSLGRCLIRRMLAGELGRPSQVVVFSRGEAKQHAMRLASQQWLAATDEVIYGNVNRVLRFVIGDVRDEQAIASVIRNADCVIHAAALKQVPTCEYNPTEAVQTNITGSRNIMRAVCQERSAVQAVVGISSDKAVKAISVYGMTKAIQERLFAVANLESAARFVSVRYGNVLGSRGSVVPLFHEQIRRGGPVTITSREMTRFFFTLDQAVDAVFMALLEAERGAIYVPKISAVRMVDLATALIGDRQVEVETVGIRPGEKVHEILISEEELCRVVARGDYYAIQPILPEIRSMEEPVKVLSTEYSSANDVVGLDVVRRLLKESHLTVEDIEGRLSCE